MNFGALKKRSIAKAIIFSLLTFGIYAVYWEYQVITGLAEADGNPKVPGILQFLCTFVYIGYVLFGWCAAEEYKTVLTKANKPQEDNMVLFIILGLVCPLALIALIQYKLNEFLPD